MSDDPLLMLFIYYVLPIVLLAGGLAVGGIGQIVQRRHMRQIVKREQALSHMFLSDVKTFPCDATPGLHATLVCGEVVIASDRLRTFLSRFQLFFGGQITVYLNLLDRARREAQLRMIEDAARLGYNAVCNIRLNTSEIGGMVDQGTGVTVEVFASGTAYRLPPVQQ